VIVVNNMPDRDHALVALAGPVAMATYMGVPVNQVLPLGTVGDFAQAIPKLGHSQKALTDAIGDAAKLVYNDWTAGKRIAAALLQRGSLSHDAALSCIRAGQARGGRGRMIDVPL
jgi:hypothetical protein